MTTPSPEHAPTEPSEETALRAEIKRVCWGRFVSESEFDQLLDRFRAAGVREGLRAAAPRDGLTPRLRALSITNQCASSFTSVGGREEVARLIERHIIATRPATG